MDDASASIIMDRVKNGFGINSVPKDTKDWFLRFADEEFVSHRGLALKHLIDFYCGLIPKGYEHLEIAIDELDARIKLLEQTMKDKKDEDRTIHFANGRKVEK